MIKIKKMEVKLSNPKRERSTLLRLPANAWEIEDALQILRVPDASECDIKVNRGLHLPPGYFAADSNLNELNFLAERLDKMDESQLSLFQSLAQLEYLKSPGMPIPTGYLMNLTYNLDAYSIAGEAASDGELGVLAVENEMIDVPEHLVYLLDYEKVGREKRKQEGGVFLDGSYFKPIRELKQAYNGIPKPPNPMPHAVEVDLEGPEKRTMTLHLPEEDLYGTIGRELGATSAMQFRITGYRACVPFASMEITDPTNLNSVNELAKSIVELTIEERQKCKALMAATEPNTISAAMRLIENLDQYEFHSEMSGPADYAKALLVQKLSPADAAELNQYLDMDSYGRYLMQRDGMSQTQYGIVCRNGFGPLLGHQAKPLETQKFYSPLLVRMYPQNEYGDADGDLEPVSRYDETGYLDSVKAAFERENRTLDPGRGLMKYWGDSVEVEKKVTSIFPGVEEHGDALWGVTTVKLSEPLTPAEQMELFQYIEGQYADGYGEGFEQRPIPTSDGDIYVSLWSSGDFWLMPENEFKDELEHTGMDLKL